MEDASAEVADVAGWVDSATDSTGVASWISLESLPAALALAAEAYDTGADIWDQLVRRTGYWFKRKSSKGEKF